MEIFDRLFGRRRGTGPLGVGEADTGITVLPVVRPRNVSVPTDGVGKGRENARSAELRKAQTAAADASALLSGGTKNVSNRP